jgi:hypothetical protein
MRNPIDIDHAHNRAIRQEIGERLQQHMRVEPELPASIRRQVVPARWGLEGQRPSIVPDVESVFGDARNEEVSRDFE